MSTKEAPADIVELFERIVRAAWTLNNPPDQADIEAVRAALSERAAPDGWKLAPVEADLHMAVAGGVALTEESQGDIESTVSELQACYRAMLAASPAQPAPEPAAQASTPEQALAALQAHPSLPTMMRALSSYAEEIERLRAALSERAAPVAWMWQHDETGRIGFVDVWQVENGWQANNPRCRLARPLYTHPAPERAAPDGWKLVPVEATDAMVDATHHSQPVADIWRDMLSASPAQPAAAVPAPDEREAFDDAACRKTCNICIGDRGESWPCAKQRGIEARAASPAVPAQVVEALREADAAFDCLGDSSDRDVTPHIWAKAKGSAVQNKVRDALAALTPQPAAEPESAERGEYICTKCGLRQDGPKVGEAPF